MTHDRDVGGRRPDHEQDVWKVADTPKEGHQLNDQPEKGVRTPGGREPVWHASTNRMGRLFNVAAAVAVALFFLGETLGWFGHGTDEVSAGLRPHAVESLDGLIEVQRGGVSHQVERLELEAGDRLLCDAGARGMLRIKDGGVLRLEPSTELRVEAGSPASWGFYLEQGQLTASLIASPRLVRVGTPAGTVVGFGGVFTVMVGQNGETTLLVRDGDAAFEEDQRHVFVPQGALVVARRGHGPGTPIWEDASGPLRKAVARLDALAHLPPDDLIVSGAHDALDELGALEDPRHSLTLWHLLGHPHPQVDRAVFEHLLELAPPSSDRDREQILARDPDALMLWRTELQRNW